ncbi:hypothetical protein ACFWAX_22520, partial [Streptomyces sp. NPDC059956]
PFLLFMQAGIGASDDESVALRVVGRSADERTCVVAWRDPHFGKGEHTTEFRCSAERARVATYWPWRGRLYEIGGDGPAPGWIAPVGILGFMVSVCVAPVLGIYRNFVW